MQAKGQTRREWLAETTRAAIIEGAGRAFSEKGYRAATMADIAAEAGLKAPSLYTYFEGKEAILLALGYQLIDEVTEVAGAVNVEQPFEAAASDLIHGVLGWMDTRGGVMRFFTHLERTGDPVLTSLRAHTGGDKAHVRIGDAYMRFFERLLARDATGSRRSPQTLATTLFGLVEAYVALWEQSPNGSSVLRFADELTDVFLYGAVGGPR